MLGRCGVLRMRLNLGLRLDLGMRLDLGLLRLRLRVLAAIAFERLRSAGPLSLLGRVRQRCCRGVRAIAPWSFGGATRTHDSSALELTGPRGRCDRRMPVIHRSPQLRVGMGGLLLMHLGRNRHGQRHGGSGGQFSRAMFL